MPVQTSKLRLKAVDVSEISDLYPLLFKQIFQTMDPAHVPGFVWLGYVDDEYVGFISAYRHKEGSVYIQYAGFLPEYHGLLTPGLFRQAVEIIHDEFQFIIAHVDRDNVKALKVLLGTGFRIIGTHVDDFGVVFVEFLRRKDNATS